MDKWRCENVFREERIYWSPAMADIVYVWLWKWVELTSVSGKRCFIVFPRAEYDFAWVAIFTKTFRIIFSYHVWFDQVFCVICWSV